MENTHPKIAGFVGENMTDEKTLLKAIKRAEQERMKYEHDPILTSRHDRQITKLYDKLNDLRKTNHNL